MKRRFPALARKNRSLWYGVVVLLSRLPPAIIDLATGYQRVVKIERRMVLWIRYCHKIICEIRAQSVVGRRG